VSLVENTKRRRTSLEHQHRRNTSISAFVGVYHQQLDEQQFSISLSSQLKIKHIHPLAFARVVGGKHQTTAAKLKTQTKAKIFVRLLPHMSLVENTK
jgi:hypothetical protein